MEICIISVRCQMAVSYKKLWKLLIDKDMNKSDLAKKAGISTYTVTKLAKNQSVNVSALQKICAALDCDVGDIMEMIPEDKAQ